MRKAVSVVRDTCQPKFGLTTEMVDNIQHCHFPDDAGLKVILTFFFFIFYKL